MELTQSFLVILIVIGSIILFVSDKVRVDLVAFLVLLALLVTGLVPETEILSGFSNPATMSVAAIFVVSAGLERTGIVRWLANRLHTLVGRGQTRLAGVLMTTSGFLSAFMNNTAAVAILLPVSLRLSRERGIAASRVLMPLSFAAQFGGVCTLIGTSTNLLVNAFVLEAGIEPFSMFEFAKLGLICFVAGMVYMLIAARFFLKDAADGKSATAEYRLQDYLTEMRVLKGSPLIGQTGEKNDMQELGENRILEIIRDKKAIWAPSTTEIREGDVLLIRGDVERVMEAEGRLKIEDWAEGNLSDVHLQSSDVGLVEVMVPHGSRLISRTLNQLDFYWRYHAAVLGVRRRGEILKERIANIQFREGDTLLLQGHKDDLLHLDDEQDFILLQDLTTLKLKKRRAIIALLILAAMLVAASTGVCSILTAALVAAGGMVVTRCLDAHEVYEAIDMRVIMLLAGLIPLGLALQSTGTASAIVTFMIDGIGQYGPFAALCVIYVMTMLLTAVMSNNATAVLLAPLALAVADGFHVDPRPFLIAVTFAASTCFTTPVGYQTNTMIYGPGGYKYTDFFKVGLPLNILFFVLSVTLIPLIWPF